MQAFLKGVFLAAVFLLPVCVSAKSFDVGGVAITIPEPSDMVELTKDDPDLYSHRDTLVPANNRQLAMYLKPEDILSFRASGVINFERYAMTQVSRQGERMTITPLQFAIFREMMRQNQAAVMKQAESKIGSMLKDTSKKITSQVGAQTDIAIGEMTNLPPHVNEARMYAFSLQGRRQIKVGNYMESNDVTGTALVLLVRNRMVYLYVYGGLNDLEWTRQEASKWAGALLAANENT